jgi:hypothetical protein
MADSQLSYTLDLRFLNVCIALDSGLITSVNANDSTRPGTATQEIV